jgi:glycogen(starch) synthase
MRRVLMTADAVGGVWPYSLDLARGLRARDVHVHLAVMGPAPSATQRHEAAAAGIELTEIPARLEWMDDPWDDVDRAGEALLALARDVAPDLIHLNGYAHAVLPWAAPAVVVAHSCICSWWRAVHGETLPPRFDEYRARVSRGLLAASAVVAPSAAMRHDLEIEYGPLPAAMVIANGSAFAPATGVTREPIVLAAGRLWDDAKNVAALCAAATQLSWPVFLAGDDCSPDGRSVMPAGVRCLGRVRPADMREWYARASIYALPARYEPFGLSVLEAARSGCALVLGDIRSLRENWDGAAVFVPPDNRRALASAIQSLIADDRRRLQLAAAATARAARFTSDRMVAAYLDLYQRIPAGVA